MPSRSTNVAIEIDEPSLLGRVLGRVLGAVAPVERHEIATVLVLTVNVFVLLSCYYVLKVVREPLILLGGGAELKAYASAGQTLLLLAVVPGFAWLSSRVDRLRLLTIMQLVFIACLLAFYVLAHARAPIGLVFYLWLGIFNVLVVSNFWSFANDLYTEEQGKRLFAIIGIGASTGAIVGAYLPHVLHRVLGMYQLMLVAAAGMGASIVLYRIADHSARARTHAHEIAAPRAEPMTRKGGFALVIRDRYLRLLAAMILIAMIINTTGEYVVGRMATERARAHAAEIARTASPASSPAPAAAPASRPSGGEHAQVESAEGQYLGAFYSDYYALVNLVSFLLQALVVARLLAWLGIRRALFIMPLVALGGWLALGLAMNLTMVRIEKTAENGLDYSLHNTLRQALFLPTSRDSKYKAKAAIDTFFFRMGDVIAGLAVVFLLVHVLDLGVRAFAALNVALALGWIVLAARAGRLHDHLVAARRREPSGPSGISEDELRRDRHARPR